MSSLHSYKIIALQNLWKCLLEKLQILRCDTVVWKWAICWNGGLCASVVITPRGWRLGVETCSSIYIYTYRVSQEECARFREGVPYVKVYRYNPKHLCSKLIGYGDNGQRKVWSSGGSTHCTCQLTSLIDVCPWVWCPIELTLALQLCSTLIPECTHSHVTSCLPCICHV